MLQFSIFYFFGKFNIQQDGRLFMSRNNNIKMVTKTFYLIILTFLLTIVSLYRFFSQDSEFASRNSLFSHNCEFISHNSDNSELQI